MFIIVEIPHQSPVTIWGRKTKQEAAAVIYAGDTSGRFDDWLENNGHAPLGHLDAEGEWIECRQPEDDEIIAFNADDLSAQYTFDSIEQAQAHIDAGKGLGHQRDTAAALQKFIDENK